jgi:hypothetical protein
LGVTSHKKITFFLWKDKKTSLVHLALRFIPLKATFDYTILQIPREAKSFCILITNAREIHLFAPKAQGIELSQNISHLVLFKLLGVVFRRELEGAAVVGVVEKRGRQVLQRNIQSAGEWAEIE